VVSGLDDVEHESLADGGSGSLAERSAASTISDPAPTAPGSPVQKWTLALAFGLPEAPHAGPGAEAELAFDPLQGQIGEEGGPCTGRRLDGGALQQPDELAPEQVESPRYPDAKPDLGPLADSVFAPSDASRSDRISHGSRRADAADGQMDLSYRGGPGIPLWIRFQLHLKPRLGVTSHTVGRRGRDSQGRRGIVPAHSGKVTQFQEFGVLGFRASECGECFIEFQQCVVGSRGEELGGSPIDDTRGPAPAFERLARRA
jgi:hypothetical protein